MSTLTVQRKLTRSQSILAIAVLGIIGIVICARLYGIFNGIALVDEKVNALYHVEQKNIKQLHTTLYKLAKICEGPASDETVVALRLEEYITSKDVRCVTSRNIVESVYEISDKERIDPLLIFSIMEVESRFDINAVSHKGAKGLMQLVPSAVIDTSKILDGKKFVWDDIVSNTLFGITYLSYLLERFEGDHELAIIAYNIGPTILDELLKENKNLPKGYVNLVYKKYFDIAQSISY